MGRIHAADLAKSPRLQRVLAFLKERRKWGATTKEISEHCGVYAVNSVIAELRTNGIEVTCKFERKAVGGTSIYRYFLKGAEAAGEGAQARASGAERSDVPAPATPAAEPERLQQGDLFGGGA